MLAYGRAQFKLDQRVNDESKTTWREHWQHIARETGKVPAELANEPDLPGDVRYLWDWFVELSGQRTNNGYSWQRLTWPDIKAWAELTDRHPEPWEVNVLRMLDNEYIAASLTKPSSTKVR